MEELLTNVDVEQALDAQDAEEGFTAEALAQVDVSFTCLVIVNKGESLAQSVLCQSNGEGGWVVDDPHFPQTVSEDAVRRMRLRFLKVHAAWKKSN